jgi:hypothetical protein
MGENTRGKTINLETPPANAPQAPVNIIFDDEMVLFAFFSKGRVSR